MEYLTRNGTISQTSLGAKTVNMMVTFLFRSCVDPPLSVFDYEEVYPSLANPSDGNNIPKDRELTIPTYKLANGIDTHDLQTLLFSLQSTGDSPISTRCAFVVLKILVPLKPLARGEG